MNSLSRSSSADYSDITVYSNLQTKGATNLANFSDDSFTTIDLEQESNIAVLENDSSLTSREWSDEAPPKSKNLFKLFFTRLKRLRTTYPH